LRKKDKTTSIGLYLKFPADGIYSVKHIIVWSRIVNETGVAK
jgi:hypothetical protein